MIGIHIANNAIVDAHYNAMKEYISRQTLYNEKLLNKWIERITNKKYNFEKVVKAKPSELELIIQQVSIYSKGKGLKSNFRKAKGRINYFEKAPKSDYSICKFITETLYDDFSKTNNPIFNDIGYTSLTLLENLSIKVCPYCNRNYIDNTVCKNGKKRKMAQLDHYYHKTKYHYLAVSFYNLIPCCGSCNKIKYTNSIGVNPYTIAKSDDHLVFDIAYDGSLSKIEIKPRIYSKEFHENWENLGLGELYKNHDDYAADLMYRIKIYNNTYVNCISDLVTKLSKVGGSKVIHKLDIDKVVFGNYLSEEELSKQSLAKLTKDLVGKYYR